MRLAKFCGLLLLFTCNLEARDIFMRFDPGHIKISEEKFYQKLPFGRSPMKIPLKIPQSANQFHPNEEFPDNRIKVLPPKFHHLNFQFFPFFYSVKTRDNIYNRPSNNFETFNEPHKIAKKARVSNLVSNMRNSWNGNQEQIPMENQEKVPCESRDHENNFYKIHSRRKREVQDDKGRRSRRRNRKRNQNSSMKRKESKSRKAKVLKQLLSDSNNRDNYGKQDFPKTQRRQEKDHRREEEEDEDDGQSVLELIALAERHKIRKENMGIKDDFYLYQR